MLFRESSHVIMQHPSCASLQARKSARIRQGSPQEEHALAEHVTGLAPPPARLADAGALAEVLVLLGRPEEAMALQRRLSQLVTDQQAGVVWHISRHDTCSCVRHCVPPPCAQAA